MGYVFALISMLFAGIGSILLKQSTAAVGPVRTTLLYYLFALLFSTMAFMALGQKMEASRGGLGWAVGAGFVLCVSVFCFNFAVRSINVAAASTIYSLEFLIPVVFALVTGYEQLGAKDLVAALLALAAVVVYGL